jgi:hypothetical protein
VLRNSHGFNIPSFSLPGTTCSFSRRRDEPDDGLLRGFFLGF